MDNRESIYIGECPSRCGGWLEVLFDPQEKICQILCDECSVIYNNPLEALSDINGYRETRNKDYFCRPDTLQETTSAKWNEYIWKIGYDSV